MTHSSNQRFDIYSAITDRIVDALESAGECKLPLIRSGGANLSRPINIASRKPYNGVNIVSLWVSAQVHEYPSNLWGTYRQWQERNCQVRKGEKSSLIVFYKSIDVADDAVEGDAGFSERLVARASWVFNAAQVDGYAIAEEAISEAALFDPITSAERFALGTGAAIEEGGVQACFIPSRDLIQMPDRRRFVGTAFSTPAEGYYSTLFHELVHWSGAEPRLARDLSGRFGSESYAMEELVAELGAAFLCADLRLSPEPRADHAAYIANWLRVMKSDKKAVFTAASKASEAANWLLARAADHDQ